MGAGRPLEYKEGYNEQAYKLCLLGATDAVLADFFKVDERTINNWKKDFPEFFQSIRAGKEEADMTIAQSLFKSAQDRRIPEQQAFKVKNVYYNEDGKRIESEEVVVVDVMKGVPANDRSIQFWLKNRKPELWRDKQEIEHSGTLEQVTGMVIK